MAGTCSWTRRASSHSSPRGGGNRRGGSSTCDSPLRLGTSAGRRRIRVHSRLHYGMHSRWPNGWGARVVRLRVGSKGAAESRDPCNGRRRRYPCRRGGRRDHGKIPGFRHRAAAARARRFVGDRIRSILVVVNQMAARCAPAMTRNTTRCRSAGISRDVRRTEGIWIPISSLVRRLMAKDDRYPTPSRETWCP